MKALDLGSGFRAPITPVTVQFESGTIAEAPQNTGGPSTSIVIALHEMRHGSRA
jgi:hypothetical protein